METNTNLSSKTYRENRTSFTALVSTNFFSAQLSLHRILLVSLFPKMNSWLRKLFLNRND
ncbi:hypothetical protein DPV73_16725 [Leptospira mayottensis]|nr:hypothetical protein DPV73_16725 [Leptospira mayottensis]